MQNLLRYIRQVQEQLYDDFRAALELPSKFITNIEETLREKGDWNWTQAAYHLVVTGHCPDDVKEWLVDQLGDRVSDFVNFLLQNQLTGEAWEKALVTGYESIRRLSHEHLLPALERFVVLASHLRGLSRFQVSNRHLDLSTQDLDNVIDTLSCLQLIAHQLLIDCGIELRQFHAFSTWLRQEIDAQASETNISDDHETNLNIDYTNTLKYIQGPMKHSRLLAYLRIYDVSDGIEYWDLEAEGGSLFKLYQDKTKKKDDRSKQTKQLPRLDALVSHLDQQCGKLYSSIAETQRRNTRLGRPCLLTKGPANIVDMRMLDPTGEGSKTKPLEIELYRVMISIEHGMSTIEGVESALIDLGDWHLRDSRFLDDREMIVAISRLGKVTWRLDKPQ
ncbi:uncharacterized protein KY384_006521 [Bacidia gigantensis]|uniref:uncharacterized protein n=1 Tax=Bacidia gigantensis TaxID=2732470 RepID=UPI001D03C013|nr:uncharacterized protein KY384_006521 [Bacidia gigantensis]KAG8528832.1 hypothetical protein KY384_006521 [Bacidia gigantensis]